VLVRIHVFRTGHIEKFLEMVFWLLRLALEVTLDDRDILPVGASLWPLLAALGTLLGAFDGGFGWHSPAAASSRFPIAQNEGSPNRLLARGVPSGIIKHPLGGSRLIMIELRHQGMARRAGLECQDGVGVVHPWELMALLREAPNVISEGFTRLLPAALQVLWVARPHIHALEVVGEDLFKILLAIDDVSW
jgi:hypothetical protein